MRITPFEDLLFEKQATLFMHAASCSYYQGLKNCVEKGFPATYIDNDKKRLDAKHQSPIACLLVAADDGATWRSSSETADCLALLYENGADLNYVDKDGYTPMDAVMQVKDQFPVPKKYMDRIGFTSDIRNAVIFVLAHGGKNRLKRNEVMTKLEELGLMTKVEFQEYESKGVKFLNEKVAEEWMEEHPNPTVEDFLSPLPKWQGNNAITMLVRAGDKVLEQVFPLDKWAKKENIPTLTKIFAGVPRDKKLSETMIAFDNGLRATYALNQRRAERKKQQNMEIAKQHQNKGEFR